MRYLIAIFFLFPLFLSAQPDLIELGKQTTKKGLFTYRSGKPTTVPVWKVSRDTNPVVWVDTITGLQYNFHYTPDVWKTEGTISSTLPPLPTQTSGSATIDNRQALWINAANTLHRYDLTQTAWVPLKISYQSSGPTNVAAGVGNGAAVYTTSLWQDADDNLVYYWNGSAWTLFGTGTVFSVALALPTSVFDISGSPVTSTGTLTGTFDNQSTNTVFAGPTSGGAATPAFRALVAGDIPALPYAATLSGTTNYHAKFTSSSTIGNSLIFDNGTGATVGNTTVDLLFNVNGAAGMSVNGGSNASYGSGIKFRNDGQSHFTIGSKGASWVLAQTSASTALWPTPTDLLTVDNGGGIIAAGLAGIGTRLVTASSTGALSAYTVGSGLSVVGSALTATDASTTNEIQTISASGAGPTSYNIDLSLSGGSVTLAEGSGINLTRSTNTITIAATGAGNGIYGGSGTLQTTGALVTMNSASLRFLTNTATGLTRDMIRLHTPYSSDDAYTNYLVGTSPVDSFHLYNFDGTTILQTYSGALNLTSSAGLALFASDETRITGDSILLVGVISQSIFPAIMGISSNGTARKATGSESGQAMIWDASRWQTRNPMNGTYALKSGSSETLTGYNYVEEYDANAGAIAVTMGSAMFEGAIYTVRCRRNGTNQITFTAESGFAIAWDTDSTTSGDPSVAVGGVAGTGFQAPFKVYTVRRSGSLIYIN